MHQLAGRTKAALCGGIVLSLLACDGIAQERAAARSRLPGAATPAQLSEQVSELRIFLTDDPNTVVGEVATFGPTRITTLDVPLERGITRFVDTGVAPDRRAGDGIFTARFAMDTLQTFREHRRQLEASSRALTGSGTAWITRGPRDTVPVSQVLQTVRAAGLPGFDTLSDTTRVLASAPNALAAARALGVDPRVTPFLIKPTSRNRSPATSPQRMFGVPFFPDVPPPKLAINEFKSLLVIHPAVLDDPVRTYDACTNTGTPGGVWSFGHLIRELSEGTGLTPEQFLMQWLVTWQSAQTANDFSVYDAPRGVAMQNLIDDWQTLSGATLNVDYFPARLLAIVNRPDLADKIGYGAAGGAGEGRFVFGIATSNFQGICGFMEFTAILEYGIKGGTCATVKAWHQRWKDLDQFSLGGAAYRTALQAITLDFTEAGTDPTQLPNHSSLNQLRTNDGSLQGKWQLREFMLRAPGDPAGAGTLALSTVKQTPDGQFRSSATLSQYLLANENQILTDQHIVPEKFPTAADSFLGAHIKLLEPEEGSAWHANLSGLANPAETRRKFSVATCDACHNAETGTIFTHIGFHGSREMGSAPTLSKFLTGTPPIAGHVYNDLKERKHRMSNILGASCFDLLAVKTLSAPH